MLRKIYLNIVINESEIICLKNEEQYASQTCELKHINEKKLALTKNILFKKI